MSRHLPLYLLVTLLFLNSTPGAVDPELATRLEDDHQALTHYAWKTSYEYYWDGESEGTTVEKMGFGSDGLAQRATLEDGRTSLAKEKKTWKLVESLVATALPYLLPNLDTFGQFLRGATAKERTDHIELRDSGYIDPRDMVTISVDAKERRAVALSVDAPFEKSTVKIEADYASIPDGPTHPSQITITSGKWRIVMKNFDYEKTN